MNRLKWIILPLLVSAGLLTALWLMLVLASMIPNAALRDNMEQSALSYRTKEAFSFENGQRMNAVSDNYADAILLNISWNMGIGDPAIASLDTKYYDGEALGESIGLYLTVMDAGVKPNTQYTRYWHGSAAFVRLMHLVTDVRGMKYCGAVAAGVLVAFSVFVLVRRGHVLLALALLASLATVQIWNIRLSLEYQPVFLICFLLTPLYLWLEQYGDRYLVVLSAAGGVLTAFFDFLTAEMVVILVPLILVVAVREAEEHLGELRKNICLLFCCGIFWLGAYGGTFLAKWTAASLVTGENQFRAAIRSAGERFGGSLAGEGPENPLLRLPAALAANLTALGGGGARVDLRCAAGVLLIAAAVAGSAWYLFRKAGQKDVAGRLLLLLGAMVFLRYLVLNNHSYLHAFFTYRALLSPALALYAWMALLIRNRNRKSSFNQFRKVKRKRT